MTWSRFRHLHQGASFVPPLSAARPLPSAAQTLAPTFLQTIAARRLATVVTVFRQLILQRLDQLLLRFHPLLQLLDKLLLHCHLLLQLLAQFLLRPKSLLQNQNQLYQAFSVYSL